MNILNDSELLQANGGWVGAALKAGGRLIARNPKTIASGLGIASLEVGDAVASQKQNKATERYLNANQEYNEEYARLAGGRS